MLDIVLLKLPSQQLTDDFDLTGNYRLSESLGLGYISSFLLQNGYNAKVIELEIDKLDLDYIIEYILKENLKLLGISIPFQISIPSAISFTKKLRSCGYKGKIIIGGHPVAFHYDLLLKSDYGIDYACIGEGEYTTLELIKALKNNLDINSIKGLAHRNGQEVIFNGPNELISDLDQIPFPSRDYLSKIMASRTDHSIDISGSRGCSWSGCSFCDVQTFYKGCKGKKWRGRSVANIVEEIESLKKEFNCSSFNFIDDDFFGPRSQRRERIFEFCNLLIEKNLNIEFNIICKVKDADDELLKKLKEAGLAKIFLGIESGVQRMLKTFNKGVTVEENLNAIKLIKNNGIWVRCGSIMADPYTNIEEIKENLKFWKEANELSFGLIQEYYALKGTPMFDKLKKENLLVEKDFNYSFKHVIDKDVQLFLAFFAKFINTRLKAYFSKVRKLEIKISRSGKREILDYQLITDIRLMKLEIYRSWFEALLQIFFKNINNLSLTNIDDILDEQFGETLQQFDNKYFKILSELKNSMSLN